MTVSRPSVTTSFHDLLAGPSVTTSLRRSSHDLLLWLLSFTALPPTTSSHVLLSQPPCRTSRYDFVWALLLTPTPLSRLLRVNLGFRNYSRGTTVVHAYQPLQGFDNANTHGLLNSPDPNSTTFKQQRFCHGPSMRVAVGAACPRLLVLCPLCDPVTVETWMTQMRRQSASSAALQ